VDWSPTVERVHRLIGANAELHPVTDALAWSVRRAKPVARPHLLRMLPPDPPR
jgi:hypothetical protein